MGVTTTFTTNEFILVADLAKANNEKIGNELTEAITSFYSLVKGKHCTPEKKAEARKRWADKQDEKNGAENLLRKLFPYG